MKLTDLAATTSKLLKNASPRGPRAMMGCVIAREVFAVGDDGVLQPLPEETWPIGPGEADTPLGRMPGDRPFYLGGVDVLLGGRVFSRAAVSQLDVEVEVGRVFRRRIRVFGDRTWVRNASRDLVPSPPADFTSMALRYERAFGGTCDTEHGPMPFPDNPVGRGYHLDGERAEGAPLPNLEDPAQLVGRWNDRPVPVGLGYYPLLGALRTIAATDHGALAEQRARMGLPTREEAPIPMMADSLSPILFNQGHPGMILEAAKTPRPGDVVRVSHARRGGEDLTFRLPDRALHLHVQLGYREHVVPMHLDQIGIVCGDARVMLSQRTVFEYTSAREEVRHVTLHRGPLPATIPAHYRHGESDGWDRSWWDQT